MRTDSNTFGTVRLRLQRIRQFQRFTRMMIAVAAIVFLPARAWPEQVTPNAVTQWNNAALQGGRDTRIGPPMVARALATVHTCIYDAWAAYDRKALGTQLGGSLRQHTSQRHLANQNKAISFAAYRAAVDLF